MIGVIQDVDDLLAKHNITPQQVIEDYTIGYRSRQISYLGRREVLSGRAKFGAFGAGKELPQLALARAYNKGDWRAGYYRDQTLMIALEHTDAQEMFAHLYAHADVQAEPNSAGRQMGAHFATRLLDENGNWRNQTQMYNSSADISCTAGHMPRLVGLGYASKLYRGLELPPELNIFSDNGAEIAFGTIGNASAAEGHFWEAVNAIGVLQIPVVLSIWDDGYGISVPNEYQITKGNHGELLKGFQRDEAFPVGLDIYTVEAWNYPKLIDVYQRAAQTARDSHVPSVIHVIEVTQPQGHSTSGSHERYKNEARLDFEKEYDCLARMRDWMLREEIINEETLLEIEKREKQHVYAARDVAWEAVSAPIKADTHAVVKLIEAVAAQSDPQERLTKLAQKLATAHRTARHHNLDAARDALLLTRHAPSEARNALIAWRDAKKAAYSQLFRMHQMADSAEITHTPPNTTNADTVSGFQVLNATFNAMLERDPRVMIFGQDTGKLGGVNQCTAGLQKQFGELRVTDTGIRESTILGQAIGMAMRGLRPIAEIQYLDYLLYCLQTMSDDLACLYWRTAGGQKAPVIIRTRGHRLEGIWHSGSPMAGILNLVRGMHLVVPRNMTQAGAFYNTLLQDENPSILVERLNAYRLKEKMPHNVGSMTLPLGVPEIIRQGQDITVVTYGPCCAIAEEAAEVLDGLGISAEIIDVRTLLPFDTNHLIVESLKKTSRIMFLDEDMPGGTTAYMLQQVLELQGGYQWLDADPVTLAAQPHRPAYGADGNYFSKPNATDVVEAICEIMNEADPAAYPKWSE